MTLAPSQSYQSSYPKNLGNLEERYSLKKCVEAVKTTVTIEQVAIEYGDPKLAGPGRLLDRCPSSEHTDRTASFTIFTDSQRFKCFGIGCGISGDVIDLEKIYGGHTETWTAMIALSARYDVELPKRSPRWHAWQRTKAEIRDVAEEARKVVRRERLFKVLVLTGPEFEIEDSDERRAAVERAWKVWESRMRRIGQ